MKDKRELYLEQLNSLHEIYLGLKALHSCTIPPEEYRYNDQYLSVINVETTMLLLGKLWIILADEYGGNDRNKHNSISFKILIKNILDDKSLAARRHRGKALAKKKCLKNLLSKIECLGKKKTKKGDLKYNFFRNKMNSHFDLNDDGTRKKIEMLKICPRDVTELLELAETAYNKILLYLDIASSDHLESDIKRLSKRIWRAFEGEGLIKRMYGNNSSSRLVTSLKPITPEDIRDKADYFEIFKLSFGPFTKKKFEKILSYYIGDKKIKLYGLFLQEKIVGIIVYELQETVLTIKQISIKSQEQDRGLGRQFMEKIIDLEKPRCIEAEPDEGSLGFYKRFGFNDIPIDSDHSTQRYLCILWQKDMNEE